jgi:hypothetical protein
MAEQGLGALGQFLLDRFDRHGTAPLMQACGRVNFCLPYCRQS